MIMFLEFNFQLYGFDFIDCKQFCNYIYNWSEYRSAHHHFDSSFLHCIPYRNPECDIILECTESISVKTTQSIPDSIRKQFEFINNVITTTIIIMDNFKVTRISVDT